MNCPNCGGDHVSKKGFSPNGKQRYQCVDCKKYFSSIVSQEKTLGLDCVYCSGTNIVKAGRTTHGEQIYKCNDCGRRFNENKVKLDPILTCPECGGPLRYKGWSNNGRARRYICPTCKKTFSGDENHLNITKRNVEKPCPYCGSENIKRGGKLKSGAKRYYCNDCQRGYNENTIVTDAPHRPDICPFCKGTHINLSGHDTKTGKQRYKCVDCGKKFVENPTHPSPKIWQKECPKCGHNKARKAGKTSGKQYYQCLSCHHKYLENGVYSHITHKEVIQLKKLYSKGLFVDKIAEIMGRTSRTIRTQIKKYLNEEDIIQHKISQTKIMRNLVLNGSPIYKVARRFNKSNSDIEKCLQDAYEKESISLEQENLIVKFGVGACVPAEYIAPYIPCSIHKCNSILSRYQINKVKRPVLTEAEKAQDKMILDRFL